MSIIRSTWKKFLGIPTVHHWMDHSWDARQMELLLCREAVSVYCQAFKIPEDSVCFTLILNNLSNEQFLTQKFGTAWIEFLTTKHKNKFLSTYMYEHAYLSQQHLLQRFGNLDSFVEFFEIMDIFQELRRSTLYTKQTKS